MRKTGQAEYRLTAGILPGSHKEIWMKSMSSKTGSCYKVAPEMKRIDRRVKGGKRK